MEKNKTQKIDKEVIVHNQNEQEQPTLPLTVEAVDMLSLENVALRKELAEARVVSLQADLKALNEHIKTKYLLGPNDAIDPRTLKIVRG